MKVCRIEVNAPALGKEFRRVHVYTHTYIAIHLAPILSDPDITKLIQSFYRPDHHISYHHIISVYRQ